MADAPATATYITRIPDAGLNSEFALNQFSVGTILKVIANGTPAAAIAGSDYVAPNSLLTSLSGLTLVNNDIILAASPTGFKKFGIGADGTFLQATTSGYQWTTIPSRSAPYVTYASDSSLTNAKQLIAGTGLALNATGNQISLSVAADILSLVNISTGIVCSVNSSTFTPRQIVSNRNTITVTNPAGIAGNIGVDVVEGSTIQKINVALNGTIVSTRKTLNLMPAGNVSLTINDNSATDQTDITVGATAGDSSATVITITDATETGFPNSFPLTSLGDSGILYWNDGTDLISLATAGTDYTAASAATNSLVAMDVQYGTLAVGDVGGEFVALPKSEDVGDVLTIQEDGSLGWSPNTATGADWSEHPATQDVDMDANGLSNIDAVHFRDNGLTGGKTFEIANNSGADLSLRINRFQDGVFQDFGILYDSRYNVPPSPSLWPSYPATQSVSYAGWDLLNGRWLNCVQSRIWQTLSSGTLSGNSYQLVWNGTGLQINNVNSSGTIVETGIVYDSVINPPPNPAGEKTTQYLSFDIDSGSLPGGTNPTFNIDDDLPPEILSLKSPTLPADTDYDLFLYYDTSECGNQSTIGLDISAYGAEDRLTINVIALGAITNNTLVVDGARTFFYTNTWTNTGTTFNFGAAGAVTNAYYEIYFHPNNLVYITRH